MIGALSLIEQFSQCARQHPDRIALVDQVQKYSYAQLNQESDRVAAFLTHRGVGSGKRVALLCPRSIDYVVSMFGILKARCACVPIPLSLPSERVQQALAAAEISALLRHTEVELNCPSVPEIIIGDHRSFASLENEGQPRVNSDDFAFLLFTSGSTGTPKPILIRHRSVIGLFGQPACGDFDDSRVFLHHTSCGWDAMLLEVFGALLFGGRCILYPGERLEISAIHQSIVEQKVNSLWLSAPLFHSVAEESLESFAGLEQLFTGGDVVRPEIVRRVQSKFPKLQITNGYGPVECVVFATALRMPQPLPDSWEQTPIGRPCGDRRCYILDAHLARVPLGIEGNIHIGGSAVAAGYWGQPRATAESFIPDWISPIPGQRMYCTGDRGTVRKNGLLHFGGRRDNQVKIRGQRLELGEVEATLRRCPDIREAAVVVQRGREEKSLRAYVVHAKYTSCDSLSASSDSSLVERVREFLSLRLADFMVPAEIILIAEMPYTNSGKIDRLRLQQRSQAEPWFQDSSHSQSQAPSEAAQSETEKWLVDNTQQILALVRPPGVNFSFLDVGGTSLSSIRLVSRIQQQFGKHISLVTLLSDLTLRQVAEHIDHAKAGDETPIRRVDASLKRLPLTESQRAIWLFQKSYPASNAYLISCQVEVRGEFHFDLMQRVVDELVQRHDALRMQVEETQDGPQQVFREKVDTRILELDFSSVPSAAVESRWAEWQDQLCSRSELLQAQHPFCVARVQLAEHLNRILLVVHHLVADGWSIGLLVREFLQLYDDFLYDRVARLPRPLYQFRDFVAWEQQHSAAKYQQRLQYWKEQLADVPVLSLPYTYHRSPTSDAPAAQIPIRLSAELSSRLRELARRSRVNLFTLLLTLFQYLLSRVTGQSDVTVGVPTSNRPLPAWEHVVGMMVNTIPMRMRFDQTASLQDHLSDAQAQVLQGLENSGLSIEQLLDAAKLTQPEDWNPLFRAMFSLTEFDLEQLQPGQLQTRLLPGRRTHAQVDLVLDINFNGTCVEGVLEYDKTLFDDSICMGFSERLVQICEIAVQQAAKPLQELEFHTCQETAMQPGRAPTLYEQFSAQVRAIPTATAVADFDLELSYAELSNRIDQLSAELVAQGVMPGHIIACYLHRGWAHACACLSLPKIRAIFMPIDPAHCDEELLNSLCATAGAFAVLSFGANGDFAIRRCPSHVEPAVLSAGAPLYIIHTSGSTGQPKGVVVGQRGLQLRSSWIQSEFRIGKGDRIAAVASPAFDASLSETYNALCSGASLIVPPQNTLTHAANFIEWLNGNRISVLEGTPTWWHFLVSEETFSECSSLRFALCGGEDLPSSLLANIQTAAAEVVNLYGPTETSIDATFWRSRSGELANVPIGKPLPYVQARALGAALIPMAIGEVGELYLAGQGIALGYLRRNRETALYFVPDTISGMPGGRMFKSGDLVRLTNNGYIWLRRRDQQLKLRGFRIEPGEIESILCQHPRVKHAIVVACREVLIAAVVVEEAEEADLDTQLRSWCQARLQQFLVPNRFVFLERLPTTASGKPDRQWILDRVANSHRVMDYVPPQGDLEIAVSELWKQSLDIEQVGRHDNFFHLGGHSLLAVQAHREIRDRLNLPGLSITDIFRFPTLGGLAAHIGQGGEVPPPPAPAVDEPARAQTMSKRRAMRDARRMKAE
ncbi:MAG: amino acid adenylation domain-containing protein [Planctomycetales bacterium]|nr:amino acid adenylation domain-containing protein [Planctomycetales bacterium]